MSASAQIKISANTTEFKRSLMDLSNFAKRGLGKSNIAIFDKTSQRMLSGEADKVLAKLEMRSERLKGLIAEYGKRAKDSAGSAQKELEYRQKLIAVTQRLVRIEKDREDIGDLSKRMKGGKKTELLEGLSQSSGKIPYIGALLQGLKTPLGLGLLAGGAVVGAGAYGVSRMMAGYERYSAGIPSRIQLMGRGARDTDMNPANRGAFSQVGMNEEDLRHARLQAMDIVGREGSTQKAVLGRAQFARNYGYDLESLQGLGAGFRAQTSTRGANRDLFKLQASLQASEIKDAIGPYLETAANMLTDIRQEGLVNSTEVLGLMSSLTKLTGNSPERVAGQVSGFQRAVQGSSGENNAFFQTAFARAGIGGKTIGGTQAAIRSGGIFGVNAADYRGLSPDSLKTLNQLGITGKGTGMSQRIGSIMDLADKTFASNTPEAKLAKARFMMPKLGAKNEVESMEMMDEFKSARASGDMGKMAEFEKKLKNNNATPEEKMLTNLVAISKSQDGQVQALQKIREIQEEAMGKQVAPAAMLMSKTLLHIDELISGIYSGLSSFLPGMKSPEQKMDMALQGEAVLSDSQVEEIKQRDGKQGVTQAGGKMVAKEFDLKEELAQVQKQREFDSHYSPGNTAVDDLRIKALTDQIKNLNDSFNKLISVNREHVEVAKDHVAATKKGVKASGRPMPTIEAEGDKTR